MNTNTLSRRTVLLSIAFAILVSVSLACQTLISDSTPLVETPIQPTDTQGPPTATPTLIPPAPVVPGEENPDEPVFISGEIPYTNPFFFAMLAEPFVLLEDQAGFVKRDKEFIFPPSGQTIGAVETLDDETLKYTLALPAVPQGTLVDVDNNGNTDTGVQVFAIAFWSNTWGGPFLEERDGQGWSGSYVSTVVSLDRDGEIEGGILVVWAPDDAQAFPTGFGDDKKLFTEDDPTGPIPAGYSLVNLDETPFRFYKEAQPNITLNEGPGAIDDFSEMSYTEAFDALFEKVSKEYPFTKDKGVDWDALYQEFKPRFDKARRALDYYLALHDFSLSIPDGHIGLSFDDLIAPQYFVENFAGSFGINLAELSDGRVIVTKVYPDEIGDRSGIRVGAEIIEWDGKPISQAIDEVKPFFGPFSTKHHKRQEQILFLTRYPEGTRIDVIFQNPGDAEPQEISMTAKYEFNSLFDASFSEDELALPIEAKLLDESGLGYIQISTFLDDYNLMARLWDRMINKLIEQEVPGIIIDIRNNGGGSGGLSTDFAAYFFDKEFLVSQDSYYNEITGDFEYLDEPTRVIPAPVYYKGVIAVLVDTNCASACEGFANILTKDNRAIVVGHTPSAGMYGSVGLGQYKMPEGFSMQFPTGRIENPDGSLLIEGTGVIPDILVPVTVESALGQVDVVLQAAVKAVLDKTQ